MSSASNLSWWTGGVHVNRVRFRRFVAFDRQPMSAVTSPMPASSNAAELLTAARQGQGDALAELYARYGRSLLALAYRLTGSRDDAEDILHDVFLGLPEALRRYDERGSLEGWLRRVTARVALTRLRSRGRAGEVSFDDDDVPPPSHGNMERLADLIAVQRAIDALPDA